MTLTRAKARVDRLVYRIQIWQPPNLAKKQALPLLQMDVLSVFLINNNKKNSPGHSTRASI
jgi:hypothetical protein